MNVRHKTDDGKSARYREYWEEDAQDRGDRMLRQTRVVPRENDDRRLEGLTGPQNGVWTRVARRVRVVERNLQSFGVGFGFVRICHCQRHPQNRDTRRSWKKGGRIMISGKLEGGSGSMHRAAVTSGPGTRA